MMKKIIVVFGFTVSLFVHAERIAIHNNTNYDLSVAIYYEKSKTFDRADRQQIIPKKSTLMLERPKAFRHAHRMVAIDYHGELFKHQLTRAEWRGIIHKSIDNEWQSTFYIKRVNGILKIYNSAEWHIIVPLWELASSVYNALAYPFQEVGTHNLSPIVNNLHKDHGAFVREGNHLHPGERLYQQARTERIKKALKSNVGIEVDGSTMPVINCAFSGGGLRAAMSTVGFLSGLEQIGLLDAMMYGAFVSGSSWGYATWCAHGGPLQEYKDYFAALSTRGIMPHSIEDITLMTEALLVKVIMDQPISVVDLFGALLANMFFVDFGKQRQSLYLSHAIERVRHGEWMMPLYAAIRADPHCEKPMWYEFSPYEAGGAWLGKYAPMWSFGRAFVDGQSIDTAPEQNLGYMLGIFGSAFAAEIREIYQEIQSIISAKDIKELIGVLLQPVDHKRLTYAEVRNFSAGLYKKMVPNLEILRLADAGSEPGSNFAYPLLSLDRPERHSDIIIYFDMTIDTVRGQDLVLAQQYAQDHNYPFPAIDLAVLEDKSVAVFKDADPQAPIILYISLWNDPALWPLLDKAEYARYKKYVQGFSIDSCADTGSCGTFTFKYTLEDAQRLIALSEFIMHAHKDLIKELIQEVHNRKK